MLALAAHNFLVHENQPSIQELSPVHLSQLLTLQDRVIEGLGEKGWLRRNSDDMLAACLKSSRHTSVGSFVCGELVAAAVLYDGGCSVESVRRYFTDDPAHLRSSINLKLVLTDPGHRGSGLAACLVENLHGRAAAAGKREACCTIHPDNTPSQRLFEH